MPVLEKACFKCSRVLPLAEFYAHKGMADGHLNKCKDCTRADAKRHRRADPEKTRAKDRERWQFRRAVRCNDRRKSRQRNPLAWAAWRAVSRAIKSGTLTRRPCEVCGNPKSEAHHDDYSKPLAVRWLCFFHHRHDGHGHFIEIPAMVGAF